MYDQIIQEKLELIFEKGILYWDYLKGEVLIEERNKKPFFS